jgi:hypothetical protein
MLEHQKKSSAAQNRAEVFLHGNDQKKSCAGILAEAQGTNKITNNPQ